MTEYGLSLTSIFAYQDRIKDSALIRQYTGQRKLIFWHILRSVNHCSHRPFSQLIDGSEKLKGLERRRNSTSKRLEATLPGSKR